MRLVACDGQVKMARIGYSPLPPNLSQEMVNSVARMTGRSPEHLSRANCANPTFFGSLGEGATSPADPFASLPGGVAGHQRRQGQGGPAASSSASAGTGLGGLNTGYGNRQQNARPVSFSGPSMHGLGLLPTLVLLAIIVVPPTAMAVRRWLRRRRAAAPPTTAPDPAASTPEPTAPPGEPAPSPTAT